MESWDGDNYPNNDARNLLSIRHGVGAAVSEEEGEKEGRRARGWRFGPRRRWVSRVVFLRG